MLIAEVLKLVFEDLEKEVMSTSKSRNQHPQKHLKRLNDWNSLTFDAKPYWMFVTVLARPLRAMTAISFSLLFFVGEILRS